MFRLLANYYKQRLVWLVRLGNFKKREREREIEQSCLLR